MKTLFLISLFFALFTATQAQAWECKWPTAELEIDEEIDVPAVIEAIEMANGVLVSIATRKDFDIQNIGQSIMLMNRFARNPNLDNVNRTKAYRIAGVLHSRVADKLHNMKSAICGYNTFYYLKLGIALTPNDRDSIAAFAIGINGTCYADPIKKYFIENNMKIKCSIEAKYALEIIKNLKMSPEEAFGSNHEELLSNLTRISEGKGPIPNTPQNNY